MNSLINQYGSLRIILLFICLMNTNCLYFIEYLKTSCKTINVFLYKMLNVEIAITMKFNGPTKQNIDKYKNVILKIGNVPFSNFSLGKFIIIIENIYE